MADFGLSFGAVRNPVTEQVTYRVFDAFFDRDKVIAAVDRTTRKQLSKAGAHVRTAARSRIRKRKKPARPGESPSSHTGDLRRGILFAYDGRRESVVIGPTRKNVDGGRVPALLEFGGTIDRDFRTDVDESRFGRIRARGRRRPRKTLRFTYDAFPYMGPALEQEAPKFPELWANTLRAAA